MYSINIGNLRPATTYSLRVCASNIIGLSEPSIEISYTTEEEGMLNVTTQVFRNNEVD